MSDAGNYTCVVRNDTHTAEHMIEFNVQGKAKSLRQFHIECGKVLESSKFCIKLCFFILTRRCCSFILFTVDLPDAPLATFEPSDQYIDLGEEAQFYCEAFVGSIPLPDSKSTITWYRTTENGLEEMLEQQKLDR